MSRTASLTTTKEWPASAQTRPPLHDPTGPNSPRWRRRHSTIPSSGRRASVELDADAVWIKVELFLTELERRLSWLEEYGNCTLDSAYTTLSTVRESCTSIPGELMDAGRRRAKVLVDILEPRYNEAIATKSTLEAKANTGIKLMESFLADLENRAHAMSEQYYKYGFGFEGFGDGLGEMVDEGWKKAESGMKSARDNVDVKFAHAQETARHAADAMKASIEHAVTRAQESRLIHYDDLPFPWRVNPYITRGYRFSSSPVECIRSMFTFSNETINIWSHLVGLIIVVGLAFCSSFIFATLPNLLHDSLSTSWSSPFLSSLGITNATRTITAASPSPSSLLHQIFPYLQPQQPTFSSPNHLASFLHPTSSSSFPAASFSDLLILSLFLFAAAKCLVCSTMWHTMSSIADQTLMERFACVDYTGISLLIAASIMTIEYTAFYCEPFSRWAYLLLTFTLGVGGVILPWSPFFNRADMSVFRVLFYLGLGATGFAPALQLVYQRGTDWASEFYYPVAKSVVVYVVGAAIYATKMPEKIAPKGWFDYVGGSHNIWHFAVLGGILFHYGAMWEMFENAGKRAEAGCSVY